jgi:hypothetical protein
MATLTLARPGLAFDARLAAAAPLIDWLGGQWGLVFSHPDDFASLDLEADRWLSIVGDAFTGARVRPLRLHSSEQRFASWIERLSDAQPLLVLERRRRVSSDDLSARAAALRSVLSRMKDRFVLVVDERIQVRHIFTYQPSARVPSVLDLIAYAALLRSEGAEERAAQVQSNVISLPYRDRAAPVYARLLATNC